MFAKDGAHPEAHLERLFPAAMAFSPLAGDPLHFNAYAVDPKTSPSAPPIGYAFWTTDLVPQEHGYHGPIHVLVGLNTAGNLTGVVVDYDSEPYGYFSVEPPKFAEQFKGKSIRDPFRVGGATWMPCRERRSASAAPRGRSATARGWQPRCSRRMR